MEEASWKGELVDEAGGAGDSGHRKTPKEPGQVESLALFRGHLAWPWEGRSRAGPVQGDVQVWWQEVEVVPV